jgi:spore germination protein KB
MMKDVKINSYQFLVLVTLFTIGSSILLVPSGLAQNAKQDAWIAAIFGTGIGLLIIWLFCTIAQWFPHLTFIEINNKLFGKWIGTIFSLLFVSISFFLYLYSSSSFWNFSKYPCAAKYSNGSAKYTYGNDYGDGCPSWVRDNR